MKNRAESTDSKTVFWAAPMLLGLLLVFGGTFAGAALLSSGKAGQAYAPVAAYVPLAVGSLSASFWGARRATSHRLPMGFLVGLLMLSCLFLLGLTLREEEFLLPAVGTVTGTVLLSALLGAIPGAAVHRKKRHKR